MATTEGSPWVGGAQAAATARERARSTRRVVERFVILMLLATFGVAVVAALPAAAHLFTPDKPDTAVRGIERVTRARGWAVGPPDPTPHPAFSPDDYEGKSVRDHTGLSRDLFEQLAPSDPLEPTQPVGAIAKRDLVLRDRADIGGDSVVDVKRGAMLLVLQDTGGWLLVAAKGEDNMQVGWAQRGELELLR